MSDMIQVTIDSVRVSLMSPQRIILLREMDGERTLPIFVGPYEAEAITVALQEIEMARPLTHDLLKNVITTFGARLVHVEIIALREKIFYGNLVVEKDGEIIRIDSRPTDAIAMAVRAHIPILVDANVMTSAGILPEEDLQAESEKTEDIEKDRLSIFEDFFDTLGSDSDDLPPEEEDRSAPDDET
jgi:bifunctional DNase/RNase